MQYFRPFPQWVLQDMPGNPNFDLFHEVKIMPKLETSTDCHQNLISSEDGQHTSACKIVGHSLHAFSSKCPEAYPDGWTDRHAAKRSRLVGWNNRPMYIGKEGISGFGRTDGRKDGQTDGRTTQKHNASGT